MNLIKENIYSVKAFAPATCANVAVGFDILGFAFDCIGDEVTLTLRNDNQVVIESIQSDANIPMESDKNTASVVVKKVLQTLKIDAGFSIHIQKGIPLSSGMGGSAASAVAALTALNAFLNKPLSPHEVASFALFGEEVSSGQKHADNIVPCIFGGFTLIYSSDSMEIIELPCPEIYCVIIHPHLHVATKDARFILRKEILLGDYIKQSANLAAFISSLYTKDISLMKKSMIDILIEPQRAHFVPGFDDVKKSALEAGALSVSFSGSGPSLFAFAENENTAKSIAKAMYEQLQMNGIDSDYWISPISKKPAFIKEIS